MLRDHDHFLSCNFFPCEKFQIHNNVVIKKSFLSVVVTYQLHSKIFVMFYTRLFEIIYLKDTGFHRIPEDSRRGSV